MTITYTKIGTPQPKNCYDFVFSFEHGDADSRESYTKTIENMTEEQLVAYVNKSKEISNLIDNSRSTGVPLPNDFEDLAMSEGFYIPVELDNYAKMHMSNYYAASGIIEIFYYNENSEKFMVQISD